MAAEEEYVPDSGAAFTFGKSRFSSNLPGKFWIRDDPVLQVACGDEHTALVTASGRVFTFGSNEWGQLGHGHTNPLSKPTCIKALKHERVTVLACGQLHTLIGTDSGHVYGFGANSEAQLGSTKKLSTHTEPIKIQGLEGLNIKMMCGGADHSMALTDKGSVYVWGTGNEGQLGLGDKQESVIPTELKMDISAICIAAGYYHSAVVTMDGKLYTFGETEGGKLGLTENLRKRANRPQHVTGITGRVMWAFCGGNHGVALTADGKAYTFGDGGSGQLGLGTKVLEAYTPHQVSFLEGTKVARASCGENHTAFLTDKGQLFTCGDDRHGKLGLDDDVCSNQFIPTLVSRFHGFQVQQVACGGCHTVVLAVQRSSLNPSPVKHQIILENMCGPETLLVARERRRQKNTSFSLIADKHPSLPSIGSTDSLGSSDKERLSHIAREKDVIPLDDDELLTEEEEEDDEVLSELEKRYSVLQEAEYCDSIRHVDSDIESESSEMSDFNKTHALVADDNNISELRPVSVIDQASQFTESQNDSGEPTKEVDSEMKFQPEGCSLSTAVTGASDGDYEHDIKELKNPEETHNDSISKKKGLKFLWFHRRKSSDIKEDEAKRNDKKKHSQISEEISKQVDYCVDNSRPNQNKEIIDDTGQSEDKEPSEKSEKDDNQNQSRKVEEHKETSPSASMQISPHDSTDNKSKACCIL